MPQNHNSEWDTLAAAPATPSTDNWKLYFKAGGLYVIDDAGTEIGPLIVPAWDDITGKPTTFAPAAHATAHAAGGGDPVKLDDLAAPDDNTDLNASASAHGLLPKLSGVSTEFLNGEGAFATPASGGSGLQTVFRMVSEVSFSNSASITSVIDDLDATGSRTILANTLQVGDVIELRFAGDFALNVGSPATIILGVNVNTNKEITIPMPANKGWEGWLLQGRGYVQEDNLGATYLAFDSVLTLVGEDDVTRVFMTPAGQGALNLANPLTLNVTAKYSVADVTGEWYTYYGYILLTRPD